MADDKLASRGLETPWVFLDASAYVEAQFDWTGRKLTRFRELAKARILSVLITEVTKREVANKLCERLKEAREAIKKHEITLSQIGIDVALIDEDHAVQQQKLISHFDEFLKQCGARTVPLNCDLQSILDLYFKQKPPFGPGRKKAEFPDAFVVASLVNWSKMRGGALIYVVSRDNDLKSCCSRANGLLHLDSVSDLLSHATVSEELQAALVEAIEDSDYVRREIEGHLEEVKATCDDGEVEEFRFERITSYPWMRVIDRDNNEFYLEMEVEAQFGVTVRASEEEDERHRGDYLSHHWYSRRVSFSTHHVFTVELVVAFDQQDPESLEIRMVYVHPDEVDIELERWRRW